jgi:protein SCO1/2
VSRRDVISWLLALAAVGAIVAGAFVTLAALRPDPVEFDATDVTGVGWGRDFQLLDEEGKPRSLADLRGKVVALYFGYTRCPDVCPLTLARLGQAVRLLGAESAQVQGVFVSVEPKRDSANVLKNYVHSFHEDFLALRGDPAATRRTTSEFKVEAGEHHSIPVFLFDPRGQLRLIAHPEASAESLAHDMRLLLRGAPVAQRITPVVPLFSAG